MADPAATIAEVVRGAAHEFEGTRGFTPQGRRLDALSVALAALDEAIVNAGPQAVWHERLMARHREEWPTLWAAIDAVRRA